MAGIAQKLKEVVEEVKRAVTPGGGGERAHAEPVMEVLDEEYDSLYNSYKYLPEWLAQVCWEPLL